MYKIGMSLGPTLQTEDMFKNCRDAGIECVEISCSYVDEAKNINFDAMKEYSERYGVKLWSFHLPFGPFNVLDISSTNDEIRNSSIKLLSRYIEKASGIGIDKYIIHPSGEPIPSEDREERMKAAKESLKILADVADNFGGTLCVEDLPRTCLGRDSADISELISADDRLRVCFDTNHLLKEDNCEFVSKIGEKIVTLHVSDYDKINERHWLPGEGVNDWQKLLSALQNVGYFGPWLYEISLSIPKTIIRDRALTCEDFVRNANEIFEGKTPTVFSKHKEELGMWE